MLTLPNVLTLSRIAVIPLVIVTFYVDNPMAGWVACGLFILAAVTDFLDGYLARKSNQVSSFGMFLDPIADKLLVAAVLLMLVGFDRISMWSLIPALIILLRELLVSGLREFLAGVSISLPVTKLAKWKTGFQLTSLPVLLVSGAVPAWFPAQIIGEVLLWAAALLTLITGYDYVRAGIAHMIEQDKQQQDAS